MFSPSVHVTINVYTLPPVSCVGIIKSLPLPPNRTEILHILSYTRAVDVSNIFASGKHLPYTQLPKFNSDDIFCKCHLLRVKCNVLISLISNMLPNWHCDIWYSDIIRIVLQLCRVLRDSNIVCNVVNITCIECQPLRYSTIKYGWLVPLTPQIEA